MVAALACLQAPLPKTPGSFDRSVPVEQTLATARSLCERYGITRVAETTYLDRIGIPAFSAMVPDSPDRLGVYNGKGLTREHAICSAIMEAIERQVCARAEIPTYAVRAGEIDRVMDLQALGAVREARDKPIACVRGVELLRGTAIDVPVGVVRLTQPAPQLFAYSSSNGLASGNTPAEALYHALFELIERHLWSTVHVYAHVWPRSLRARAGLPLEQPDDPIAAEVIDAHAHPVLAELIERVRAAGLRFRLLSYVDRSLPVGMMACISEPFEGEILYHLGFGCSWSPVHAAVRAITEAAQARLTDIQGAREDLKRAGDPVAGGFEHGRRPAGFPAGRWYFDGPARRVTLARLPDRSGDDMNAELRAALEALRACGQTCVACVDLSPPDAPVSVVRVLTPHLERTLVDGSYTARTARLFKDPLAARR